jgi:hypothetical protein
MSRSRSLRLLLVIRAATVVVLCYLLAVELGLFQALVNDIVYKAAPLRCSLLRGHLRRIFLEDLAEVLGTLSAWVESLEQVDVLSQRFLLFVGGLLGESGEVGVQKFPGCAAEFCSIRAVLASRLLWPRPSILTYLAVSFPSFGAIAWPVSRA